MSQKQANYEPAEPEWLAKPSAGCCLKGHIHSGTALGRFEKVDNIETYISEPPAGKANGNIILYYADVYGMFTNGLLIMDEMAKAGYLVLGLDYFQGDPVYLYRTDAKTPVEGFDFNAFLKKHGDFAAAHVPGWIDAVKHKYGKPSTRYACVGYCFGAPYVCDSLAPGPNNSPPACQVGAFAHPAFLKEEHFRKLEKPLLLSCAETDFTFGTESRNKAVDVLIERKATYHVQLFSGVEHGFALRCDLSVPYERWAKEQSLAGIIAWFDLHLGENK
ncbi:hypothetical protein AMS68_007495 [Peltaster fructicola]|uniref:Dienelactone hydrolase domain-containing protein n=1 Tax=Peltaster fructicola TaxID=286661 RepID=A0A6H0Y562_9PEZI|nr:hypothetical protein AMS68_007495 [Peltaster fructicola]